MLGKVVFTLKLCKLKVEIVSFGCFILECNPEGRRLGFAVHIFGGRGVVLCYDPVSRIQGTSVWSSTLLEKLSVRNSQQDGGEDSQSAK